MEKELIKTNCTDNGITISGRELHEFLEIKTEYKDWMPRMIGYGFIENVDFNVLNFEQVRKEGNRNVKRIITDHEIKLDMAKEIAMIQRNEKGKKARRYFIEVEKAWNTPEMIMKRALEIANRKVQELQEKNNYQEEVIQGLTKDIPLQDKRSILNKVVKQGGNYKERYSLLYNTYKEKYHIDLKVRFKNYNAKNKPKIKSVMEYADKKLGAINDLYGLACKLFESDIDKLVQEMYNIAK